tara:strand:+ start:38 stop:556 length:519 start_codon:yes stop_codon:yes gene_type:complete
MSQNCVLKGTLITLEDGETKEIENLKVGEKLLSYSVEGLENTQDKILIGKTRINEFEGEFSYQLIKNIWKNTFKKYYKINNKLRITEDHFVMCQRQRKDEYFWIQVEDLMVGDLLFKSDGSFENIDDIEPIEEEKTVYNIQVNSIYSYFADGYLVHNGSSCDSTNCNACYKL